MGALLSVPTVAFLNNAMQVLLARDPAAESEKQTEEADDTGAILQAEPDRPGDHPPPDEDEAEDDREATDAPRGAASPGR